MSMSHVLSGPRRDRGSDRDRRAVAKVRVHELAKELGVESKVVVAKLQEMGEFVRSASSTVEAPVVRKLREAFPAAPAAGDGAAAAPRKAAAKKPRPGRSRRRPPAAAPTAAAAPSSRRRAARGRAAPAVARGAGRARRPRRRPPAGRARPRPAAPAGQRPRPPTARRGAARARPVPRPGNNPFASRPPAWAARRARARGTGAASRRRRARRRRAPGAGVPAAPRPGGPPPQPGHDAGPRPAPGAVPAGPGGARPVPAVPAPVPASAGAGGPAARPGGGRRWRRLRRSRRPGGGGPGGPGGPGGGFGGRPGGRWPRSAVAAPAGAFGRPGGRPARGRKSKKQRRQEFDNMQAPSIGGVHRLPRGNGEVVRLPRGASLTDFAEQDRRRPRPSLVTDAVQPRRDGHRDPVGQRRHAAAARRRAQLRRPGRLARRTRTASCSSRFDLEFGEDEGDEADLVTRPPVVTVMGHVDHGKTKLLDAIRNTNVVEGEAGGITQHIGAYQVARRATSGRARRITFIDTPGHEAFTAMRARGAQVTDIAILVVAADDGVKPQTIEALNHAQAADVPIVVAVNKIDKEGADPAKVRGQLTEYGLVAEEYGGDTMFVDVSAKRRHRHRRAARGVSSPPTPSLDLRANPDQDAQGVAIEAHLDRGRGPVATVLVQRGTLRAGDSIVAGDAFGRVRAMLDEHGDPVDEAGPSRPVQVLGLTVGARRRRQLPRRRPRTGSPGRSPRRRQARERNAAAGQASRPRSRSRTSSSRSSRARSQELNLILKGDVSGSVEALEDALLKIDVGDEVDAAGHRPRCRCDHRERRQPRRRVRRRHHRLQRPAGRAGAASSLDREGVDIRYYSVIYQAIDEIEAALKGMLKPEYEEVAARHRRGPRGLPLLQVRQHRRLPRPVRARSVATPRRGWSATAPWWRTTSRSTRCSGSRTTPPRSARASSAVSASARSTTSRSTTSSRRSRCARSRAPDGRPASDGRRCSSGSLELDLLLGDVHSLKEKRAVVRPIVAELRRRFEVAAAEAGHLDLHRRALVGVAVVAPDARALHRGAGRLRAAGRRPPGGRAAVGPTPAALRGGR